MRMGSLPAALVVVALLAIGCGDDDTATPPDSTTSSSTTTTTTTTTTSTTTTTTTVAPAPVCTADGVLAAVDAAIALARLTPGEDWSSDTTGSVFAERTTTGDEYAERLGLDCGLTASQSVGDDDERLVIAAWTGPRTAYLVQSTDGPSTPYRLDATVTVTIDATEGEFLDGDGQALWAGTFDSGETFVIGHEDHVLGLAAKDWVRAERPPVDDMTTLDSERHAIAALEEAGMRRVGIAEPPQFGSEEGYVEFTSPAGQIMVVDVAPTDWFDPTVQRYFTGPSTFETLGGIEVRVTEPMPDDNLGFIRGVEFGWVCDDFVWILQPPFNGDGEEIRISVDAIVATVECTDG